MSGRGYSEGWITVPGKGRRWRTADGTYMLERPAGSVLMGALTGGVQGLRQALGGAASASPRPSAPTLASSAPPLQRMVATVQSGWSSADRALGGWLPGGGVASPITRQVSPPQPFPGRSQELYEQTGVRARFVDTDKTPTLVSKTFSLAHGEQGVRAHANVFQNEVGFPGYQGGRSPEERETEMHELGHINPADRSYYTYGGAVGRGLGNLSDRLGNPPLLEIGAGIAKQYLDAPEEDRAERFAARHAGVGGYTPPSIDERGRSGYGNSLREWGRERVLKGFGPLGTAIPAAQERVQTAIRDFRSREPIEDYQRQVKRIREQYIAPGLDFDGEGNPTAGFLEAQKGLRPLEERLRGFGLDPVDLMN